MRLYQAINDGRRTNQQSWRGHTSLTLRMQRWMRTYLLMVRVSWWRARRTRVYRSCSGCCCWTGAVGRSWVVTSVLTVLDTTHSTQSTMYTCSIQKDTNRNRKLNNYVKHSWRKRLTTHTFCSFVSQRMKQLSLCVRWKSIWHATAGSM